MFNTPKISLIALALCTTLISTNLLASNDEDMVKAIMKLRADVESLYTQIDQNKDAYKASMKSLALQSADSDAQINRKITSIKLLELDLEKLKVQIANTSTSNIVLKPLLEELITALETSIIEGIPFKVQERLSALRKIQDDLDEGLITSERALALLWSAYDDNIRLTKEIGLFKQNIEIDSKNILADVAKIGTVMLYFKTPDNRVGYITEDESDNFVTKVAKQEDDIKEILSLFDALNKQIRTGFFTLPNALVLQGDK